MKIEEGINDSLSIEHKEEIPVIFHKSMDLLISSILNGSFAIIRRMRIIANQVCLSDVPERNGGTVFAYANRGYTPS